MSMISFTRTILHNLFTKPVTRPYPQVPKTYMTRTRGQIGIDIDACIFCGICMKKCPTGAITVAKDTKTWSINPFGCIQCGACTEFCPKKCLSMLQTYAAPNALKTAEQFTQTPKEVPAEHVSAEVVSAVPVSAKPVSKE